MQKFVIIGCCNYFDFCRPIENCSEKNNELRIFVQQLWNITHPGYSFILLVPLYFGAAVVCWILQAEIDGVLYIVVLGVTHGIYFFAYHSTLLHIKRRTKLICIDNTWEI